LLCLSIRLHPSFSGPWTVFQQSHFWSSSLSCCVQLSVHHF
jgi:hypothetical protein